MCGIFGVVGRKNTDGLQSAALTLKHRGPDGFGDWSSLDQGVYLAHCRLAIIDLSAAGRQPMENEDGSVRITFNGEIYNFQELRRDLLAAGHKFRSQTDTEVIVHAYEQWGRACVERLRGIFAFAIWDENKQSLLIARDRLGVKPLYFRIQGDELAFASEPRALIAMPGVSAALDVSAALQFLRYSYTTGSQSIYTGIRRLGPGEILEYQAANACSTFWKYWSLPRETQAIGWEDAVEQTESLLKEATREELVSDVPVGVFLSGGVDSSLISTYAVQNAPQINSFCVDFAGWKHSESDDATIVASHIGTVHHTCVVDQAACSFEDAEVANNFFSAWDEPLADQAIIPTWHLSRLMKQHVTVALSGDGGDELFGGYRWYMGVQGSPRRRAAWRLESLRRRLGVGRQWPTGCADEYEFFHLLHCPSFTIDELIQLFPCWTEDIKELKAGQLSRILSDANDGPLRRWQRVDAESYLVDNNLARVDRASMAHGLEVRVPILDHRIAELAFQLPDEFGCLNDVQKPILRELTKRHLPERIQKKPKQGFSFPLTDFVSVDNMVRTVQHGTLGKAGLLDVAGFRAWNADAKSVSSMKIWILYTFEQWAKHWLFRSR